MIDVRSRISDCCRRLNRGVVLKVAAEWLAVWLCVFGTVVIVAKRAWPGLWPGILWAAISVIPVLVLSRRRALERRFLAGDGAALLDDRLGAHGLLMTVAERPDSSWRQHLPADEMSWAQAMPRLRPIRFAKVVWLPAIFLGIALTLPAKEAPLDPAKKNRPRLKAVTQLPQMLEELKKADVLEAREHKFLKEEIDKIVEQTKKAPPNAEQWRKIDELRARLAQRLNAASRKAKKGKQAAERLANAAKSPDKKLTKRELKQLEQDLQNALARMAKKKGVQPSPKKTGTAKTPAAKTQAAKTPGSAKTGKITSGKTQQPMTKTVAGNTPMRKTTRKTASPTKTGKTTPRKTGSKVAKAAVKKTPGIKNSGVGKTKAIAKTGGQPRTGTMAGKTKSGGRKTIAGRKTASKTQSGLKTPVRKTGVKTGIAKTPVAQKSPAKKSPGKKSAKQKQPFRMPNLDQLPDITKLLELASKLPPSMQQQIEKQIEKRLMQMARDGQLKLPEDPEMRRRLMQQAMKLLQNNADKLDELQKRFGHLARKLPRRPRGRDPRNGGTGSGGKTNAKSGGGKSARSRVAFRDVVLPPGFEDRQKAARQKVTGRAPNVAPVKPSFPEAGNTDSDPSHWQSWKRNYPPRYRSLLRKYFEPDRKK